MAGTFSRKRFSGELLAEQLLPTSRDQAIVPRDPLRVSVRLVTLSLDGDRFTEAVRALNSSPTPDGITETRQPVAPLPDYEPGLVWGRTLRSIPSSALKAIGRFSYPSPAGRIAVVGLS